MRTRPKKNLWAVLGAALALLCGAAFAPSAQAAFGVNSFDVTFTKSNGTLATEAGSHPFAATTSFGVDFGADTPEVPNGRLRDVIVELPEGFVADATAYPRCSTADFATLGDGGPSCPLETVVGITAVSVTNPGKWTSSAIYNLPPPPGVLLRLGFNVLGTTNVFVDAKLSDAAPYRGVGFTLNAPETLDVFGSVTQLWGDPSDPGHDDLRGQCGLQNTTFAPGDIAGFEFVNQSGETCPVAPRARPFLTLPTDCRAAGESALHTISWEGEADSEGALTHDSGGNPLPFSACGKLNFNPSIKAQPTTKATTSPTGLDFSLDVKDEGLTSVTGKAHSQIRKVEVTLPEGMSANPSLAEGLEVCSEGDLAQETLHAAPGEGCPSASRIGTLEVESPLIAQPVSGSLYQATPYANLADDALLAFYIVFKSPQLGILVKQPAEVISDPETGQLTTVTDELPQLPFSSFRLHFREGSRSPLISPPSCGAHTVKAMLYPYSGTPPVESNSTFQLISGPDSGPCPSGGLPPFHPRLFAGTLNNAAGRFSPFNVELERSDSEQEITHFSIKLPPGVVGKLAGVVTCSDAAIAAAQARTGPLGGHEELAAPSCPAASQVGSTLVGTGVGPSLAYAPGSVYLAGPYHGAPLSIVAITAGVVGPFDIGTVVVREALRIDPETAEIFIDATDSDPIPHIIKGIPVHLRDIRVYTDRPEFVLNPTSCEPTSTASTVLGAGLDFASPTDDNPFVATSRFQAADCAALPFKPKLSFRLKGGTHRGAHPALRAHVSMKGLGEAAIRYARVTLPHSEFLEQGHIGTICTRVQFKSGIVPGENCPPASVYGRVRAVTPILDGALEGPIFLRSSEHPLPDLVAALHHAEINVALVGRIDSVKGQIRNTFDFVPDAPVTSADFFFGAGKKSLLVNSTNICKGRHEVKVELKGHNGKRSNYTTPLKAKCGKKK